MLLETKIVNTDISLLQKPVGSEGLTSARHMEYQTPVECFVNDWDVFVFHSSAVLWNALPNHMRNIHDLDKFKTSLKKYLFNM